MLFGSALLEHHWLKQSLGILVMDNITAKFVLDAFQAKRIKTHRLPAFAKIRIKLSIMELFV